MIGTATGVSRYVFGPVPSRRLGRSLGVDLTPGRACPFDCIYCQLGRTRRHTSERGVYAPIEEVMGELRERLMEVSRPDFITLSGSGEPTLHERLGEVISGIRGMTDAPIAILTGGSLLWRPEVRRVCGGADVVLPTLAAVDEEMYRRIHRPSDGMTLERHVEGIAALRREGRCALWLELFLVRGVNDDPRLAPEFLRLIGRIEPQRVQINTAVRPPSEGSGAAVSEAVLDKWARALGPEAEIIAEHVHGGVGRRRVEDGEIVALCLRHASTAEQIGVGLGMSRQEARVRIARLLRMGKVRRRRYAGATYYGAEPGGG